MCNPKSTRERRFIALFPLGQIVATPGALEALEHAAINAADLIQRHQSSDWGNVPPGDAEENMRSVENGWRILSSYPITGLQQDFISWKLECRNFNQTKSKT